MRQLTTNSGPHNKNDPKQSSKKRVGSNFASKAFIGAATATTSFAAYYCATALLFSTVPTVNGDTPGGLDKANIFKHELKKDDTYGVKYVGFDSYAGVELDDGTGDATKEYKAASHKVVYKALEAAGLDETGMTKGFTATGNGDDNTLHRKHGHRVGLGTCPSYGCPFLPLDVHYDETVKLHLENMRKDTPNEGEDEYLLKSSGTEKAATLTLIGYKGGELNNQINQDRALALAPYLYGNINSSSDKGNDSDSTTTQPAARLIGAFDGHATFGEKVSEYVVKTLPALLGSKLVEYDAKSGEVDQQQKDLDIGKILHETFLELDATSPAEPSGGCTASMVLQLGTKIYIANAGDSRSFIGAHVTHSDSSKSTTTIIFGTREDKPHLPTERDRVENMGGTVYLPNGFLDTGVGTTRVLYNDPTTGSRSGLAMSRSLGDWDAGAVGVIPDPLIDILDINDIKKGILNNLNGACDEKTGEVEIDPAGGESVSTKGECFAYTEKNVKIFAISATDGLLDYLPEQSIVGHVAKGLYDTAGVNAEGGETKGDEQRVPHLLMACEDLIYAAAQGWQKDKGGRYRDDIAIAVTELELE